eukprot:TRINITY_DN11229_c0_g2_i1.p1 TRINITY_DN11229_c0_g2~~TRINITY_DN11229_c0_g2_i1.p1  ORF type:complete len:177 (+),score=37.12 TRINITY_DN11229_c0_g2_i1:128-658(+)
MPMVFFMAPSDPRMLKTIEAIKKELSSSSCVYRYKIYKDAAPGKEHCNEGVECDSHNAKKVEKAEKVEKVEKAEKARVSLDNIEGEEGYFSMCSFWLIEAMTRCGQLEEARIRFEEMLSYANHLGLYAEQIGFDGNPTGNFPQAFTHLSLISAAFNLDRKLSLRRPRLLNSLETDD